MTPSQERLEARSALWACAAALTCQGIVSCGPTERTTPSTDDAAEEFASAFCGAVVDCQCNSPLGTQPECEELTSGAFRALILDGYMLDRACLDVALNRLTEDPCGQWMLLDCNVLTANRGLGEPCTSWHQHVEVLRPRDCRSELSCDGTCQADLEPVSKGVGGACHYFNPATCHDPNLYCTSEGSCAERAVLGEPCVPLGCRLWDDSTESRLFCAGGGVDETGVCQPQQVLGAACDPSDHLPCAAIDSVPEDVLASCDPEIGICVEGQQTVCGYVSHPFDATQF